jgi:hypothetical protein
MTGFQITLETGLKKIFAQLLSSFPLSSPQDRPESERDYHPSRELLEPGRRSRSVHPGSMVYCDRREHSELSKHSEQSELSKHSEQSELSKHSEQSELCEYNRQGVTQHPRTMLRGIPFLRIRRLRNPDRSLEGGSNLRLRSAAESSKAVPRECYYIGNKHPVCLIRMLG